MSSLSSLSLEAFPNMPSLRHLFDAGRGNSSDFAPKSALETNSGASHEVVCSSNHGNDEDRFSSAAMKESLRKGELQHQESVKAQSLEPEKKQKSPQKQDSQNTPKLPNSRYVTTPTSTSSLNSVNNSPSRVLDASDPASKIRLMKYVVLSKAKSSPSVATDKKELSLILNGLRELKKSLNNIERLGCEFKEKLDARVENFRQYRLQKDRHQLRVSAAANAADAIINGDTDNC